MIERREFLKKIVLLVGVMGGGALLPVSGKAADQEIGIVVEGRSWAQVQRPFVFWGNSAFVRRETRLSSRLI
jgi:hypothetical protein